VRRALLVIAAVAGCCLFETALLLSSLLQEHAYRRSVSWHAVLGFAQFLLLPGMAALYSRFIYGRRQWGRRALILFLAGTAAVPVLIVVVLLPLGLLAWAFDVSIALFFVVLLLVVAGMTWGLFLAIRKTGERSVQIEASRWLAERQAGIDSGERKWRNRGIGWSLWIPSLTVLAVFLFLPQIWGVLTHLQQPQAGRLPGYQIPIPATWVVLSQQVDSATGHSWVGGLAAQGINTGLMSFFRWSLPFFSWDVETEPYSQFLNPNDRFRTGRWRQPRDDQVIARRVFTFSNASLACLEYLPDHFGRTGPNGGESPIAYIECSGLDRLHASFVGERSYVPAFYKMLAGIVKTE
jgi:hypothetical protein